MENPIEMDDLGVLCFLLVKLMWTNYRGCFLGRVTKNGAFAQVRAIATLEDVTVDVRDPKKLARHAVVTKWAPRSLLDTLRDHLT